jgi:hypothetical protein
MAGGAGAGFLAGVFDFDAVLQGSIADRGAWFGFDHGPFGADLDVRKENYLWHGISGSGCVRKMGTDHVFSSEKTWSVPIFH